MGKAIRLLKQMRMIIFILVVVFSIVMIRPIKSEGVAIRSIVPDSAAAESGMIAPSQKISPISRERIIEINDVKINSVNDYYDITEKIKQNQTVFIKTNKQIYSLTLNFDDATNKTQDIGIGVYEAPSSNIKLGLDLEGGTSILLSPKKEVNTADLDILVDNIKRRLNVYGLSDIVVRSAVDFDKKKFILVEVAGLNQEEVVSLVSQQGNFEAKIKNQTVFSGSDIVYVGRGSQDSGIDPRAGCINRGSDYVCQFFLGLSLSQKAAQRQADLTKDLQVIPSPGGEGYLSENITFFLDGKKVDELTISQDLKGKALTEIRISGSGTGPSLQEARENTLNEMKEMQTILITGNLPVELEISKIDSISPVFGKDLLKNVFLIALISIAIVSLIIFIYYRKIVVSASIVLSMVAEVIIILGFAVLLGQDLDLAAMAGIIVSIGTGVDDVIVITDEALRGKSIYNWKQKIKRAFFIVFGAYFATMAAMIPLMFAGAGLLRGFAITTMIGITAGVLVTRPAFAKLIEILLEERKEYSEEK